MLMLSYKWLKKTAWAPVCSTRARSADALSGARRSTSREPSCSRRSPRWRTVSLNHHLQETQARSGKGAVQVGVMQAWRGDAPHVRFQPGLLCRSQATTSHHGDEKRIQRCSLIRARQRPAVSAQRGSPGAPYQGIRAPPPGAWVVPQAQNTLTVSACQVGTGPPPRRPR
jgi:hypothetical protein